MASPPYPDVPAPAPTPWPRWPSPFPPDVAFRHALPGEAPRTPLLPEERALLGPRALPRRVEEFALGRACARAALADLAARAGDARGEAEAAALAAQPILRADARKPRWPPGFVGTLTHHRGQAAAAVASAASYRGVGVDLEAVRTPSAALLRRILRPDERDRWEALPDAERATAFIVAFSAKESVYKALYPHTGVYLGFQDAEIEASPAESAAAESAAGIRASALRWCLYRDAGPDLPAGHTGEGRALLAGDFVLTAVWLGR